MRSRSPAERHLELAVDAYGADLPLRGVIAAATVRSPAAAPSPVAPATPAPGTTMPVPGTTMPVPGTTLPAPDTTLPALRAQALVCTRCRLASSRTQVVFGEGCANARVMFVGEAPGFHEDREGRPFVGAAGQLLERIITNAMGLRREDVYIANVIKCRPPDNRDPEPDEVAACLPYLREQVRLVQPRVIVCLGRVAARALLGTEQSMGRLRGQELAFDGVPVVATWHPAYLLRKPEAKAETWEDIKRVNRLLGAPEVPER